MTDFSHLHALEERAVRIRERMIDVQKNDAQWKAQAVQLFQTEKEIADERELLRLEDISIDNTKCDHSPSRIDRDGICLDCKQKVMKTDCDCGICMFCYGMRKMVNYFGFDPRHNGKCLRCGKERKEGRIEICCM